MGLNDGENADWVRKLQRDGEQQAEAIEALRHLLLRAALLTFSRSLASLQHRSQEDIVALAEDCAQDALVAVLEKLPTFRGESRFTTWAYKFGVHKALETARRESWTRRSIDPLLEEAENCGWGIAGEASPDGSVSTAQAEVGELIRRVICEDLSIRQRQLVKLMVFDEVPMDVVTERLHTNRNAVYKMLHDARRLIRRRLEDHGYAAAEVLGLFSVPAARQEMNLFREEDQ